MSAQERHRLAEGEKVFLRHPVESDREEWCALWDASWPFLEPWMPRPPEGATGASTERFDRLLETADTPANQRHVICRQSDSAIVGMVNLSQIFRGPFCNAIMGYWVGEAFARSGYAGEGVMLALGRAFGELGLHRVEANIIPNNLASIALANRVGFREEGYSPRYLKIAGTWQDHIRFAMTAEDWQALRADQPK
ncbi:MAG: GNAT family N-acetyltransferase [Phycisphaerales bacterium JB058]